MSTPAKTNPLKQTNKQTNKQTKPEGTPRLGFAQAKLCKLKSPQFSRLQLPQLK
jgi:hypothetical protein